MAIDSRIPELPKAKYGARTGVYAKYNPQTNKTEQIELMEDMGAVRAVNLDWQATNTYSIDNIIIFNLVPWKSLQNNNSGNVPSENPFWTELIISPADGITLTPWAAGLFIYYNSLVISSSNIYQLIAPVPFESTDIDAEIIVGDWVSVLVDPSGGFVAKAGDSMTGALHMQNAELQIHDSLGNLRGVVLAEMNYGMGVVGKNDVQAATELLILGDPVILGRKEIGMKFNGAAPDSYLAIGKSYDFNGETIFPIFSIPLPPPTIEETFTDNLDYALLAGNTQIILTGVLVNNYTVGSNFELHFTVQEVGGRDTDIDFWFEIDGVIASDIYNRAILDGSTTVVNLINVTANARTAGDTVTVVVQQKTLGNNTEAVVVGTQSLTALRLIQQAPILNQANIEQNLGADQVFNYVGNLGTILSFAEISSVITTPIKGLSYKIFDTSGHVFSLVWDGSDFWYERLTKAT